MNSVVYMPERWDELLAAAKKERYRLGLDGKVAAFAQLHPPHRDRGGLRRAHDAAAQEGAGASYIRGLDILSLSQYMDLTAAVPPPTGPRACPAPRRSSQALLQHEKDFRQNILIGALGLKAKEIPPLHIGEFGIGRGGLRHPNLWAGAEPAEQEKQLAREIARGHEGLLRYLALPEGRTARSARPVGHWAQHYDVFGWENPKLRQPGSRRRDQGRPPRRRTATCARPAPAK